MLDQNNNEIQVGQYLKIIGCKVKGDNGIYIVETKYSEDSFCLYKVLQNGERSTTKYNIYFLDNKHDPDKIVTIISKDQLKKVSNEVKNYVEGVTSNEIVYSFSKATEQKPIEGLYVHFKKSVRLTGHINSVAGTYEITKVDKENRIVLHMVGKRGEKVAWNTNGYYQFQPIMLSFKADTVKKLFDGGYIEIWERHESTKGEQQKEIKPEVKQEEQNNMSDNIIQEAEQQEEDILSKFDKVEVTNNNRISDEDKAFCIAEQEQYNSAIQAVLAFVGDIKTRFGVDLSAKWHDQKSNNKYIDVYQFRDFADTTKHIKNSFISNIVSYFISKYSVTLSTEKIIEKYNYDITYENILDDIFIQLGGYNFIEKAHKEIKDNLKSLIREHKNWRTNETTWNIEVKGKRIVFTDLIYATKGWNGESEYSGRRGMIDLCKALSLFDCNSLNILYRLQEFCEYTVHKWAFDTHQLNMNKVESMKIFKNSKIELNFTSAEHASYFAKEYCGYIQKSA